MERVSVVESMSKSRRDRKRRQRARVRMARWRDRDRDRPRWVYAGSSVGRSVWYGDVASWHYLLNAEES